MYLAVIIVTNLDNVRYLAGPCSSHTDEAVPNFIKIPDSQCIPSLPVPFGSNATVAIRSALPTLVELLHRNVDISTALCRWLRPRMSSELIRVHAGYNQLVVLEQRNPSQRAVWVIPQCVLVCYARFFLPWADQSRLSLLLQYLLPLPAAAMICGSRPASIPHISSKLQICFSSFFLLAL